MSSHEIVMLSPGDTDWLAIFEQRMGKSMPNALQTIGHVELLRAWKTGLFCSERTPGAAILSAYDTVRILRDRGVTVISGFHSPIEKECFNILFRGKQPIILCPARSLTGMRLPRAWQKEIEAGRMLILSSFSDAPRRVTTVSAARRNELVAALADEVFIAHGTPGGKTEALRNRINEWGIPFVTQGG